jgi:cation diffusion facilitator family transporter
MSISSAIKPSGARESGVLVVVLLTTVMMVVEIGVGYATHSMALLADGWHMATHVGALGLASVAYAVSRRFESHRAFTFGTGKVHSLAGYTSAVGLGIAALLMVVESATRLVHPNIIDFTHSLPVAVVGLLVNLLSIALLHRHDEEHDHEEVGDDGHDHHDHDHHDDDHNYRAAVLHVMADALTSALAIVALFAGRRFGWLWLDAVSGIVGGLVILYWGAGLCRSTAFELLDVDPVRGLEQEIRGTLEALDDVQVSEIRVWSLGLGARSCVLTLNAASPLDVELYREQLRVFDLAYLNIEVRRCVRGAALLNEYASAE